MRMLDLPPEPKDDVERILTDAVATVVLNWFKELEHWFRGCSVSEANLISREVLFMIKAEKARLGYL
jgi:hypothetical protein